MNTKQERAAFEAWATSQWLVLQRTVHGEDYQDLRTQAAWEAYQAGRAALPTQPKAEFEDPRVQKVYEIICGDNHPPEGEHWDGYVSRLIVDALQSQDQEDALRYRYLVIKLQQAYDGDYFETDLISLYCHMPSQYKGERVVRAEITWRDKSDEPIGLSEAIDHARRIEENK